MNDVAVITDKNEVIQYKILLNCINEFNQQINSYKRSTFMIICTNTLGSLVGYLSGLRYGNVPLMLGRDVDYESVKKYELSYKFNYLWAPNAWLNREANEYLDKSEILFSKYDYSLVRLNDGRINLNKNLALLLTTSGTTGSNKLVRISRENILSNTKAITEYLDISDRDRAITSLPMNYTYGLSVINTHLYQGGTILLTERKPFIKAFWDFFCKYNGSSFAGVPYTYELIKKMGIMSDNIDSLRTFTVAGGKIGITEEEYFTSYAEQFGKKFIVMYGQTEATARISYRPWKDIREKKGSIGIAIPGGKMWLEDEQGNEVTKTYAHGELMYSGKNVTMGYAFERDDLSKDDERNGILNTGDLGYIDEDGYFYVIGRGDRCVKMNGHRLDLEDMEDALREKYPTCSIRCEVEKCMDSAIFKIIKVDMSDRENSRLNAEEVKKTILKRISINSNLINVVIN